MTEEHWLPVVGFEGIYEVSDLGRVRTVEHVIEVKTRWGDVSTRRVSGGIRPQYAHPKTGHLQVSLTAGRRRSGRWSLYKVHHLVLEAFAEPRPEGEECCHANDDPADNRVANLRWDTRSENLHDRTRNGRVKTHCPQNHEYTPENTRILKNPPGARRCRICEEMWAAERKKRQQQQQKRAAQQ